MEMTQCAIMKKLCSLIEGEMNDALYYRALSKLAGNECDRRTILDIAEDEECHAAEFKRLYSAMTGKGCEVNLPAADIIGPFKENVAARIGDEVEGYRKYRDLYLCLPKYPQLQKAVFCAGTDENVHALALMRILLR